MPIKILFVPFLAFGHLQLGISLGKYLLFKEPTAEIYFLVDEYHSKKLNDICSQFKSITYSLPLGDDYQTKREQLFKSCFWKNEKRFEQNISMFKEMYERWRMSEKIIMGLIDKIDPDLILTDSIISLPFIQGSKYKSIMLVTLNQLVLGDQINHPPIASGVERNFEWYSKTYKKVTADFKSEFDKWYSEFNLTRKSSLSFVEPSALNVNLFPEFMNYFDLEKDVDGKGKWMQVSSSILKKEVNTFIEGKGWTVKSGIGLGKELLTTEFLSKPGKLILVSLGTLLSSNLEIFHTLLPVLAEIDHKFIISKGSKGDHLILPSNCVGSSYLNQVELLSVVELFISHCGSNSMTEAIYYGVPMLCVPGFMDQQDNAARLQTFGIGKKISLQDFTKKTLNYAIEEMTSSKVKSQMKKFSESLRNDNSMERLTDTIIDTALNN